MGFSIGATLSGDPTWDERNPEYPEDQGAGTATGTEIGASVALMDEFWWAPMTLKRATKA